MCRAGRVWAGAQGARSRAVGGCRLGFCVGSAGLALAAAGGGTAGGWASCCCLGIISVAVAGRRITPGCYWRIGLLRGAGPGTFPDNIRFAGDGFPRPVTFFRVAVKRLLSCDKLKNSVAVSDEGRIGHYDI